MAYATLNSAQAATIRLARQAASDTDRKAIKKEVFAAAKLQFGIPENHKLVAETDATQPNFGKLKNASTGSYYDLASDGRWVHAEGNGTTVEPKFWLSLGPHTVRNLLIDDLVSDGAGSDDAEQLPGTATVFGPDGDMAVDADGYVYVLVSDSDLA